MAQASQISHTAQNQQLNKPIIPGPANQAARKSQMSFGMRASAEEKYLTERGAGQLVRCYCEIFKAMILA